MPARSRSTVAFVGIVSDDESSGSSGRSAAFDLPSDEKRTLTKYAVLKDVPTGLTPEQAKSAERLLNKQRVRVQGQGKNHKQKRCLDTVAGLGDLTEAELADIDSSGGGDDWSMHRSRRARRMDARAAAGRATSSSLASPRNTPGRNSTSPAESFSQRLDAVVDTLPRQQQNAVAHPRLDLAPAKSSSPRPSSTGRRRGRRGSRV